jgi:HSP20 family protein
MSEESKSRVMPVTCVYHDEEKYAIEVELPGVKKEDIEFYIMQSSFCVKAPRKDVVYQGCWILCHEVVPEKAVATFKEGLLQVSAPMARQLAGVKVKID